MVDKSTRTITFEENDWRNMLITEVNRTGGDPSIFFEILESVVKERAWETLLDTDGNPVGSLRRLIEAPAPIGCGQKVDKVLRLLEIEHRYERDKKTWHRRMDKLRKTVHEELGMSIQSLLITSEGESSDISRVPKAITTREYRIDILKRDAPDVAEKVIAGEITDAKGMKLLAKRHGNPERKQCAVNLHNAESARQALTKYMPPEILDELILLLIERKEKEE